MKGRTVRVAAVALAVLATGATGQQPAMPPFYDFMLKGEYLHALQSIEHGWETGADHDRYTQLRPELDGFVVMTDELRAPLPPADSAELAAFDGAAARDAIAEIVERARHTRVVIVNEAHDNPRDRAFILAVVEALRPLGYTHYAAETFSNGSPQGLVRLSQDGFARRGTGFYTADPMFGYLVRRAMALGYRPVAYEATFTAADSALSQQKQIARREQAQAENLAQALAAAGPDAKFLVHVGYGHAYEQALGNDADRREMMAARFARMTGLDPLTIDQVALGEFAPNPATRALFAALADRVGNGPKVFTKRGQAVNFHGFTDLQVVHPRIAAVSGRPDWLRSTGRRAVPVPVALLPQRGRRLVQVFVASNPPDATPIDQALVASGQAAPVLYVPRGAKLRWEVQDEAPNG